MTKDNNEGTECHVGKMGKIGTVENEIQNDTMRTNAKIEIHLSLSLPLSIHLLE